MKNYKMDYSELQVILIMCFIFFLRMLGIFSILPVLSKYGLYLKNSNKFLIGISIGIYGMTQMLFQIPFGIFSDILGKKKVIIFGLLMFLFGSIISATTYSIWGLIIGRAIQGICAISGVSMALLSDLIRKENYIKAVSFIGATFSISFLISMISGPLIVQNFSFSSVFWISSIFSIICILVVCIMIPNLNKKKANNKIVFSSIKKIHYIFSLTFFRFYLSIFLLHFLLTMNFLIIPNKLESSGLPFFYHWLIYLITILVSFFILFLVIFYFKSNFIIKNIIGICIFLLLVSSIIFLISGNNLFFLIISLQIFFVSFSILEISLPTQLSKKISDNYKSSVMSVYSTSQFLGIFFGGVLNGWFYTFLNFSQMFLLEMFLIFLWLIFNYFYKK